VPVVVKASAVRDHVPVMTGPSWLRTIVVWAVSAGIWRTQVPATFAVAGDGAVADDSHPTTTARSMAPAMRIGAWWS